MLAALWSAWSLPSPSYWPIVTAAGLPIIGYGLIYNLFLCILGGILLGGGLYAWALEPVDDPNDGHGDDHHGPDGHGDDGDGDELHPHGEGSHAPLEDGSAPEGYTIKGNMDSLLYHRPDSRSYDVTVAEVWFDSTEAAEAAGFGLADTHPAEVSTDG